MITTRTLAGIGASALIAGSLLTAAPAFAADTTWVSGVGDDVNPCSRTAPCKTFAGAISKTSAGGVIVALDSGGFGNLTITKAITIDGTAVEGGVLISGVNGFIINNAATDRVVLRGVDIVGGYTPKPGDPTACSLNGLSGVRVVNGGSVVLEDSRITGTSVGGVVAVPTSTNPTITVQNTVIRNSCGPAVQASPGAGATATVRVVNSTLSANDIGVAADQGGSVTLQGTTVFGNGSATRIAGNGSIDTSDPTNHLVANETLGFANTASSPGGATRTWVSGVGSDANPCSRTAPCQTLAGAFAKTATGGQISVLDNGSFGPVTITRAITIDGTSTNAAVSSAVASSIVVNVPASEDVILRHLQILGTPGGSAQCPYAAQSAVKVLSARSVHVEDSTISGFTDAGIDIVPASSATRTVIDGTVISNVCGKAVNAAPAGQQRLPVLVRGGNLINNGTGIQAATGADVSVVDTTFTGNGTATGTAGGTITVLPSVKTPDPVIITEPVTARSQTPVACKSLPKKLKASSTRVLLDHTCVTSGGKKLSVRVSGKARIVRQKQGKVLVKTKKRGTVTVTFSAAGDAYFLPFSRSKTYNL